jgi:ferric-dicitrate binding protein FerR (iron transport regulator)
MSAQILTKSGRSALLRERQNWSAGCWMGARWLHRLIVIAVTLLSGFAGSQAGAQGAIGAVSRIQGQASGTHGGATRVLGLNASVFLNDVILTDEGARLEVTLTDNTRLTLGEKAKLTLDTYLFNPGAGRGTIKFGVVGAFRFVSGQVSKVASADVSVTTPFATIGIRGTEFWCGPIDDQVLGVFLIEGVVSVSNAAGEQILSQPGQGTNIATPGAAPGPVTFWPSDKVNRALATVAFQ